MLKTALLWGVVLTGFALATYPQSAGLWLFDDPAHLGKSTLGSDLVETGTHTAAAGIAAGDGAVLDGIGSYYTCVHGLSANGGGIYVNQWTVLLDVRLPASSAGNWVSLFQTNTSNANDGDCFVSTDRTIGISATGYTSNVVPSETWMRVVVSVSNSNFYRIYVNGVKWLEGVPQPLDGRFGLEGSILLFADENGEDYPIRCTTAAIWGQALTDVQIGSLGGPSDPVKITQAADYVGMNLLSNSSGESDLMNWTIVEGFDWQATDRTDWHFPRTGSHYFTSGRTVQGQIAQMIDVSFLAVEIDSGTVLGRAGGNLGGDGQDQGRICVQYLDAAGNLLATDDSGWIAGPGGKEWVTVVVPDEVGLLIPAGTRSVRFGFLTQRLTGEECEAFGDDFVWEYSLAEVGNTAPAVPSARASGTAAGIEDIIAFMFSSIDPEGDLVRYQADWGDGTLTWSEDRDSGTNYIVSHSWKVSGSYVIRARARDSRGGLSAWSLPLQVTISGDVAGVFKSQPYLQNVSQNAMTIAWETDRLVAPRVDWGLTTSYGSQAEGVCIDAGSGVYICKVRITGLAPQTQYHFRARNGSTLSADGVFRTAPLNDTPFSVAVWGDSQQETNNPAVSLAMFTDMAASADLGVSVGDIVQNSDYSYFANPFRKYVCNTFARQKPFFVAFGNHDEPQTSFVHKAVQNSGMTNFSFNYGNAHFTCIDYSQLNDNTLPYDDSISSLPLGWLEQDLSSDAAQNAAWRFVFVHVPPYCERWFDGSPILRTYLVPLMKQYGVQICFSGHTHEYERGRLEGTYYIISGCTSYLDTVEPVVTDWPHMTVGGAHNIGPFVGGCVHGYTKLDIDGTQLALTQHGYYTDGTYYGVVDAIRIVQADFTGYGAVDMDDFAVLARAWRTTPQDADWNPACDLADRASRMIDLNDLAEFVQVWQRP